MRHELTELPIPDIRYTAPLKAAEQLRYAIEAAITVAEKTPTILPAAEKLLGPVGIGRTTAVDSYGLLGDAGLVQSRRGGGTAVTFDADRADIVKLAQELVDLGDVDGVELPYLQALLARLWPSPDDWGSADTSAASVPIAPASPDVPPAVPVSESWTASADPQLHRGSSFMPDGDDEDDFS